MGRQSSTWARFYDYNVRHPKMDYCFAGIVVPPTRDTRAASRCTCASTMRLSGTFLSSGQSGFPRGRAFLRMKLSNKCQQASDSFRELVGRSDYADHQISFRSEVIKMAWLHQHPRPSEQGDRKVLIGTRHRD